MGAVILRWAVGFAAAVSMMGALLASAARAQEAAGEWHGLLSVSAVELRIGVKIAEAGGTLTGSLTSPDQGPGEIPIQDVRMEQGRLTFAVPMIRGRYEGQWDSVQGVWNGQWIQGAPLPLTLARGPVPSRARPQLPAKPYPYREEGVSFESAPGVKLAGTLTLPPGKGPFPAAVLITGSGPQDRDEQLLGHRPFLVLADDLTRRGIAVLRFDDRGVAKSTGRFQDATAADFAVDTAAGVAFLRARDDIDPKKVGLIGHSEGGIVAPMVAAKDPQVAYVVLMAAPAVPLRELLLAQRRAIGGAAPAVPAGNIALMERIDAALAETADFEAAKIQVTKLIGAHAAEAGVPADRLLAQVGIVMSPWYRDLIRYDPRPVLAGLKPPVLAVNGANDLQVIASQNLPAMRQALKAHRDATIVELPGLNHLFQTSATGSPMEYGRIEETFAPTALNTIGEWVVARTKR